MQLAHENFLYLGDVARLPYGTKSAAVVTRYARHCVQFLLTQNVKAIVIACNTASAMALPTLRQEFDIPLFGVISAGVAAGIAASRTSRILVLATDSAVRSEAYPREFQHQGHRGEVEQVACPLLVPLAEEGWFDHPLTAAVIAEYLGRSRGDFDSIVMGCTHYPLLENSFRRVIRPETNLVHGGSYLARELSRALTERGLENPSSVPGRMRFLSTDRIAPGLPLLSALFRQPCQFEVVDL